MYLAHYSLYDDDGAVPLLHPALFPLILSFSFHLMLLVMSMIERLIEVRFDLRLRQRRE
jgi:hypothetical protein